MTRAVSRRTMLLGAAALAGCSAERAAAADRFAGSPFRNVSDAEWRRRLGENRYRVLRKEQTERAGSSSLNAEKRAGTYVCAGCALPLFRSQWKYESGTGWPSFWQIMGDNIGTKRDLVLLIPRTEYHCARCLGHQGHVFDDGPQPTGLRYCNNGLALRFVPA